MLLDKDFVDNEMEENKESVEEISISQQNPTQPKRQRQQLYKKKKDEPKEESQQEKQPEVKKPSDEKRSSVVSSRIAQIEAKLKMSESQKQSKQPDFKQSQKQKAKPISGQQFLEQLAEEEEEEQQEKERKEREKVQKLVGEQRKENEKEKEEKKENEKENENNKEKENEKEKEKEKEEDGPPVRMSQTRTYEERVSLLEKQKKLLQEKQSLNEASSLIVLNQNRQEKQEDLDLDKLNQLLKQSDSQQQYEPGQSNTEEESLPTLKTMGTKEGFHEVRVDRTSTQGQQQQVKESAGQEDQAVMKERKTMSKEDKERQLKDLEEQEKLLQQEIQDKEISDSENEEEVDKEVNEAREDLIEQQLKEELLRKEIKQQNEKIEIIQESPEKQQEPEVKEDKKEEEEKKEETKEEEKKEEEKQQQKVVPYPKPLANISMPDIKTFLTQVSPQGGMIQCTIKRDKSGMGRFYPRYHMYLTSGFKYLMSAKKRSCNNTSNYLITMNKSDFSKKHPGFLGKVRSNFLGTEFTLYDNGDNPKKVKSREKARCQLGMVFYESNILGSKGPRKMKVLLPKVSSDFQVYEYRPLVGKEGMMADYEQGKMDNMKMYINRPPKWNDHVQAYVLNFYGRVDKPSVKNFQLVEEGGVDSILLQFGRVGEEMFNLDFQHPITPLQAFEIVLTSFDYKIACE